MTGLIEATVWNQSVWIRLERQRHRGEEEEDEEDREEALHRLARAGAQGGEEPDRAEGDGDRDGEGDDHQRAGDAGRQFGPGDQARPLR